VIDATTSAPAIAAAVHAGETRAREVVAGALERIAQRDRTLNAFTAVLSEAALADATRSTGASPPARIRDR
jgi:Asp-tRNA(Asn)/Glu-tRNA(Gln) amidotransferase A subunit family amidase